MHPHAYAWRCWAGQGSVSQHTYGCGPAGCISNGMLDSFMQGCMPGIIHLRNRYSRLRLWSTEVSTVTSLFGVDTSEYITSSHADLHRRLLLMYSRMRSHLASSQPQASACSPRACSQALTWRARCVGTPNPSCSSKPPWLPLQPYLLHQATADNGRV